MAALQGQFQFRPSILPLPGEPTQEFSQLMDERITAFDKGVAEEAAFNNALATFEVPPGYEGVRNELATTAEERLGQLAERYKGAYEDPRFQREALAVQRELVKNPTYNKLAQNKVNYDLYNQALIDNPNQYNFKTWEDHLADFENTGEVKLFTPQLEEKMDFVGAVDRSIEPFLNAVMSDDQLAGKIDLETVDLPDGTQQYFFKSKKDGLRFNLDDRFLVPKTEKERSRKNNAVLMYETLERHALPTLKKDAAGDQYRRKLEQIDHKGEEGYNSDIDLMKAIEDRFPPFFVPGQEAYVGNRMSHVTKGGNGSSRSSEYAPYAIYDPAVVETLKDGDAAVILDQKNSDPAVEQEYKAAVSRIHGNTTYETAQKEDGSLGIAYKGSGVYSEQAEDAFVMDLATISAYDNLKEQQRAINNILIEEFGLPEGILGEDGKMNIHGVDPFEIARAWVDEEQIQDMQSAAMRNAKLGQAADNFFTKVGRLPGDIMSYTPFLSDEGRQKREEKNVAMEKEQQVEFENRYREAVLQQVEELPQWKEFKKKEDELARQALSNAAIAYARLQFRSADELGESTKNKDQAWVQNQVETNLFGPKIAFELYNVATMKDATEEFQDFLEEYEGGTQNVELVSFLPSGSPDIIKTGDLMELSGKRNPHNADISVAVTLEKNGEKETRDFLLRGVNANNIVSRYMSSNAAKKQAIVTTTANLFREAIIMPDKREAISPAYTNYLLRVLSGGDYGYADIATYYGPEKAPMVTGINALKVKDDVLNLHMVKRKTADGYVTVIGNVVNGVFIPKFSVSNQSNMEALSDALLKYYADLLEPLYKNNSQKNK